MDENKQAMIEADEFDMDTMLVMFRELQTKQLKAAAEGVDGLSPEMRKFIEEAKASGRHALSDPRRGREGGRLPGRFPHGHAGAGEGGDRGVHAEG
jgi:hypothetical protein